MGYRTSSLLPHLKWQACWGTSIHNPRVYTTAAESYPRDLICIFSEGLLGSNCDHGVYTNLLGSSQEAIDKIKYYSYDFLWTRYLLESPMPLGLAEVSIIIAFDIGYMVRSTPNLDMLAIDL